MSSEAMGGIPVELREVAERFLVATSLIELDAWRGAVQPRADA